MNEIYTLSMLLSIGFFTLTTHITPGPTNIILLSSVLNFGYKRSLPYIIGNIISYPIMMCFIALGIGMFLIDHPIVMSILKTVGIIYLCYMAWKIATNITNYNNDDKKNNKPFSFWQGFIYPWLNPKAWIVYTSTVSIYISSTSNTTMQLSIIVIFILISMIITTYTWSFGGILLKGLMKNEKFSRRVNLSMSTLLILSVVPIIL